MWPAVKRAGDPKIVVDEREEHELENKRAKTIYPYAGYPLITFNEFKDRFVEKVAKNIYNKMQPTLRSKVGPKEFEKLVRIAAEAADKIVEEKKKRAGGKGFEPINGDLENIPEFIEAIRMIVKMMPEEYRITSQKPPAKFKQVQKQVEAEPKTRGLPEDVKLEVLSILQALEFADYSEKAKEKALQKFSERISELSREDPTRENLLKIGLYAYTIELIMRNRWEKVEKLREL